MSSELITTLGVVLVLFLGMMFMPAIIEDGDFSGNTCSALEKIMIRNAMNKDPDTPQFLKSFFASAVGYGSRAFRLGEAMAAEQHPGLPSVFGCAVVYWNAQLSIALGVPVRGENGKPR